MHCYTISQSHTLAHLIPPLSMAGVAMRPLKLTRKQVEENYARGVRQRTAERQSQLLGTQQTMDDIEDHEDIQEIERSNNMVKDKRTVIMNLCCVIVILVVVIGLLAQQLALLKKELHRTKQ